MFAICEYRNSCCHGESMWLIRPGERYYHWYYPVRVRNFLKQNLCNAHVMQWWKHHKWKNGTVSMTLHVKCEFWCIIYPKGEHWLRLVLDQWVHYFWSTGCSNEQWDYQMHLQHDSTANPVSHGPLEQMPAPMLMASHCKHQFAQQYWHWTAVYWKLIAFSDDRHFQLHQWTDCHIRRETSKSKPHNNCWQEHYGLGNVFLAVSGSAGASGRHLTDMVTYPLSLIRYIHSCWLFLEWDTIFQQDNETCHTTNCLYGFRSMNQDFKLFPWP